MKHSDQLLVGSVPLQSAQAVFTACCTLIGDNLHSIPDGEFGDRIIWHNYLARFVYNGHPDIETTNRPAPTNGYPEWKPRNHTDDMWHFKLKPGVSEIKFDELGYAKHAITSYEILNLMKELGKAPAGLKLQVNIPLTQSAISVFFHDENDHPIVGAGYEDAAVNEIRKMLEVIPASDVVILWDVCVEILHMEGLLPWMSMDNLVDRNTDTVANIMPHIPEEVEIGYHLCYGTLPTWPMAPLETIKTQVTLTNALIEKSGRKVDFMHLVLPKEPTDEFFEGVEDLTLKDIKLYLGLLQDDDTLEDNLARITLAEKYFPEFGTSYVCGFGRRDLDATNKLLERHVQISRALAD